MWLDEKIIVEYAQLYCKGYGYADHMSIDELEDITINRKKQLITNC